MSSLFLTLITEEETTSFARKIGSFLETGDIIALSGDLGAGKSTFARSLIQSECPGPVPSPTFTLVQIYEFRGIPLWHFDLYRLSHPEEAWELGIEEAFSRAISVIEWPERLGCLLPSRALRLNFLQGDQETSRHVKLSFSEPRCLPEDRPHPPFETHLENRWKAFDFSPWRAESCS